MEWELPTEADMEAITMQIGRKPKGVLGIVRRCRFGQPQVTINKPVTVKDGAVEIFPTMFWLTCPLLNRAIGRLESRGSIADLQTRLEREPDMGKALKQAHEATARLRLELIPQETREWLKEAYPRQFRVLAEAGVGGAMAKGGIKCLHTHYADHMARGENPIGEIVERWLKAEQVDVGGEAGCFSLCARLPETKGKQQNDI